jgi:hypothetical protein
MTTRPAAQPIHAPLVNVSSSAVEQSAAAAMTSLFRSRKAKMIRMSDIATIIPENVMTWDRVAVIRFSSSLS